MIVCNAEQEALPSGTVNERPDRTAVVLADDQIALKVTENHPAVRFAWAFTERHHVLNSPHAAVLRPARLRIVRLVLVTGQSGHNTGLTGALIG
ncbi:hypothetical protein [Plantibacter sp. RU18]|uniref:hypothetical protein n=1 Tax=Plantibacter sp. RU18 TaxID=3158143 RepID=UPI003D360233